MCTSNPIKVRVIPKIKQKRVGEVTFGNLVLHESELFIVVDARGGNGGEAKLYRLADGHSFFVPNATMVTVVQMVACDVQLVDG
jgi:hypothetical protein